MVRITRNRFAVSSVRKQIQCFSFNVETCAARPRLTLRGVVLGDAGKAADVVGLSTLPSGKVTEWTGAFGCVAGVDVPL